MLSREREWHMQKSCGRMKCVCLRNYKQTLWLECRKHGYSQYTVRPGHSGPCALEALLRIWLFFPPRVMGIVERFKQGKCMWECVCVCDVITLLYFEVKIQ